MPTKKEKQPLSVTHPELAKEADGWDPTLVSAGSGKKYKWRCEHGHEWLATCGNRTISKSNCPVCAGQKAWPGFNDVATTHPMLAVEADGWNPTEFIAGTNRKLAWKCKLNHSWTATGYSRIAGSGCPYCTNQKLLSGFNDLRTKYPEVARQADGWDPKSVGAGSSLRLGWKCEVGHQWTATVMGRTGRDKTNCPICSNKVIHIGFNDLLTTRSDLAKEAEGWDPTKIGAGSNAIVKWKCQKGHIWKASVKNRTIKNSGCPFCSNHKIQSGFNDLRTTHPVMAT